MFLILPLLDKMPKNFSRHFNRFHSILFTTCEKRLFNPKQSSFLDLSTYVVLVFEQKLRFIRSNCVTYLCKGMFIVFWEAQKWSRFNKIQSSKVTSYKLRYQ